MAGEGNKVTLDPKDEFERHIIDIVEMNRKKRADYANEQNIYNNFDYVEQATQGMVSAREYCDIMVTMKNGRIINLRGRNEVNEVLEDTYIDRAVYAVLALGLYRRESLT